MASPESVTKTLSELSITPTASVSHAQAKSPAYQCESVIDRTKYTFLRFIRVLLKADMLEYYSVSGCYILRPSSFSIWEIIQEWFNAKIKEMEVENAYFLMFISVKALERETDYIEGFSPEIAWVTRAGQSDLEEPIAIRLTSDTAMYPYYAKWMKSHRDLPVKLNQWNSVSAGSSRVRSTSLSASAFVRCAVCPSCQRYSRVRREVLEVLDLYHRIYEELLAVLVIPGVKSEKEKFVGGNYTMTVEHLGQNFSNIFIEDPNDPTGQHKTFVWQNSWGLSTHTIGIMVMVHGDNQGLVLPPRVASVRAVVVPCGITAKTTDAQRQQISDKCAELVKTLKKAGVRAKADLREGYTPGWKFNEWEQKGVPLRLEIGPQDLAKAQTLGVRRDTGAKAPIALAGIERAVPALLETIQAEMFQRAKDTYDARVKEVTKWEDVVPALDDKCVIAIPWCEAEACEDDIKERSGRSAEPQDERAPSAGAKSLAIPFEQSRWTPIVPGETKCPACGNNAKRWTLFGRSY